MPLVAAAVCPHPPLLVPGFDVARELGDLRFACREALALLWGKGPDEVVVVASGPSTGRHPGGVTGSLAPWGLDLPVTLGAPNGGGTADLPLGLLVGAWLLGAPPRPVSGRTVDAGLTPADCAALGRRLAGSGSRVALLVMGDGAACRGGAAPGDLDPRSEPFDAAVVEAFRTGDADALLAIDPVQADELMCGGRAPWQVLAGAAEGTDLHHGRVHYAGAPYGVGYVVASWT